MEEARERRDAVPWAWAAADAVCAENVMADRRASAALLGLMGPEWATCTQMFEVFCFYMKHLEC